MRRDKNHILITDAPPSQDDQLRRREIRYVVMMLFRAVCLILAAWLATTRVPLRGLWVILCLFGMVFVPWIAVILANDRPPKRKAPPPSAPTTQAQPAIAPRHHKVIDADD